MSADLLERPDVRDKTTTDDGDHDKFAHYVPKDEIVASQVTGTPARALCGKLWHPNSDPERYPVCPDCKRVYDEMPTER